MTGLKCKTGACGVMLTALMACMYAGAQTTQRPAAAAPSNATTKGGTQPAMGGTQEDKATTAGATEAGKGGAASAQLARSDRKFVEEAATGGLAEVELGKLAEQKASNDQVKQFGARMVEDHAKANGDLKQLAQTKGISLPAAPDKSLRKEVDKLNKLSGADFDREYSAHMLSDHRKDVAEFKKAADSAKDSDIKAFAGKTLPTLQEHLKLAQSMQDSVKGQK